MEYFYIVLVAFLLILSVSDLMVGVSNDASNFLNAAIGSKAAPFWIIIIVASVGIVFGATFSSGMMDIARNGIFNPEKFCFAEIILIFVGVMLSDVLLLNIFNTLGLPTSTTVSIVFNLLGASLAMAVHKVMQAPDVAGHIVDYINTGKSLAIISGILLSVVIAFTVGSIVQYFVRMVFTFNYKRTMRIFGGLFGGIAITSIIYFMIMKGLKGSAFMRPEYLTWISQHSIQIVIYNVIGWSILLQTLYTLFRINILRVVILAGTLALAMAFAGNDLVNFIGVPLAGLESLKLFMTSGQDAHDFMMSPLADPVQTSTWFLLAAGLIMAATLAFSKQSRKVIQTTLSLSRQDDSGNEQFGSSLIARLLVRFSLNVGNEINKVVPSAVRTGIDKRFKKRSTASGAAFDQLRAAINLVVASLLIASATSLKLPLSTTYVTFMVAMGTSLADRAWDRESAVYRITGVITVIGGWFITALCACILSFILTNLIIFGGVYMICALMVLVLYILYKSHHSPAKSDEELTPSEGITQLTSRFVTGINVFESTVSDVSQVLEMTQKYYLASINGVMTENRKKLKDTRKSIEDLGTHTKSVKTDSYKVVVKLHEKDLQSAHLFVQIIDYMREISLCLRYIITPLFEHVDNNHAPLIPKQIEDLTNLNKEITEFFKEINRIIQDTEYNSLEEMHRRKVIAINTIDNMQKKQLTFIKRQEVSSRNSILYLNLLNESKNMILFCVNTIKSTRDFYNAITKENESELSINSEENTKDSAE